jgi:hypothetical protein
MGRIESPHHAPPAAAEGRAGRERSPRAIPEPPTARALWPTFMHRTLAEDQLRPRPAGESRPG